MSLNYRMSYFFSLACLMTMLFSAIAQAGVVLNGTRVIYSSSAHEVTVKVTNKGNSPVLIQSWLDTGDANATPDRIVTPFTLTPPINRVEANKGQVLRIASTNTSGLPQDRESLYWLNVMEIPAKPKKLADNQNYIQLAIRTRVKFFYRPESLKGDANQAGKSLSWTAGNSGLSVNNMTPYHVSLLWVSVNGKRSEIDMVNPMTTRTFESVKASAGNKITAAWVDDYGAYRKQDFIVQ